MTKTVGCSLVFVVASLMGPRLEAMEGTQMNVAGVWVCQFGLMKFEQDGLKVHGALFYDNSAEARIEGAIRSARLRLRWGIDQEEFGEAVLELSDDQNHLSGVYADLVTGRVRQLVLTRHIELAGQWTSDFGPVVFEQHGYKVGGFLQYDNGPEAWIDGVFRRNRLRLRWGIGQQEWGEAVLSVSPDGNRLSGSSFDLISGKPGRLVLNRAIGP